MYNVLIADDEPAVLAGMEKIIDWESLDLRVTAVAQCGTEALALMEKETIHILITDIRMPHMDGLQLLHALRSWQNPVKCIILSGHDDFQYVKEAAKLGIENYLLKPLSEVELTATLQATVRKIQMEQQAQTGIREGRELLRNNILSRWATGTIDDEELTERSGFLQLPLWDRMYLVVVMRDGTPPDESWRTAVRKHLSRSFPGIACNLFLDADGDQCAICACESAEQADEFITTTVPACLDRANRETGHTGFATIGSVEASWRMVRSSYAQAKRLVEYKLVRPSASVLAYRDIEQDLVQTQAQLPYDITALTNSLVTQDEPAALRWLDDTFAAAVGNAGIKPATIRKLAVEVLIATHQAARQLRSDTLPASQDEALWASIQTMSGLPDIVSWLKSSIAATIRFIREGEAQDNSLYRRTLAVVKAGYRKDLNLKTVAAELGSNPAYLGQLFKREAGVSFTTYLNTIRIERAKELLATRRYKASDIAEMVGYGNLNYFYTIFKKHTGASIAEYREQGDKG